MIIAVDGPAASGKGTLSARLAAHYGLPHLDTGLLYRGVGHSVIEKLDTPELEDAGIKAARTLDANALDAELLGSSEVAMAASRIARIPEVRAALLQLQRDFAAQPHGAVLDGRDIGTKICPHADVKLFVTATPEARANRRWKQLSNNGVMVQESEILAQISARDESDRTNPAGTFYPADDAHLLDTTKMDIEAAFRAAIAVVDKAVARKAD